MRVGIAGAPGVTLPKDPLELLSCWPRARLSGREVSSWHGHRRVRGADCATPCLQSSLPPPQGACGQCHPAIAGAMPSVAVSGQTVSRGGIRFQSGENAAGPHLDLAHHPGPQREFGTRQGQQFGRRAPLDDLPLLDQAFPDRGIFQGRDDGRAVLQGQGRGDFW